MELQLTGITKTYADGKSAVRGIDLRVRPGVLGLLGPNGAGKSSLMRILATVTRPTAGEVTWNGIDVVAHPEPLRRTLGYLPQDFGVYPHLTASEFLGYLAAAKGLSAHSARARIDQLLALVNLTEVRRRPLGRYSGGMRQRVGIAQALLNDPHLLIVDEPTVGLDPEERMRFRTLLADLAADRVVILSTHIVSDVEAIADHIAVISEGGLRLRGTPEELLRAAGGRVWEALVPSAHASVLRERHVVGRMTRTAEGVRVRLVADAPPAEGAIPVSPDLEDAYLWAVRGASVGVAA